MQVPRAGRADCSTINVSINIEATDAGESFRRLGSEIESEKRAKKNDTQTHNKADYHLRNGRRRGAHRTAKIGSEATRASEREELSK